MTRCKCFTKTNAKQCRRKTKPGKLYCWQHKNCINLVRPRSKDKGFREYCQSRWKSSGEVIGRGGYGKVLVACEKKKNNCDYVLKVQKLGKIYQNELNILLKLNKIKPQIAPYLFDHWVCEGNGYLILEKMEGDLRDENIKLKKAEGEEILRLIDILHKNRIAMIDALAGNVLRKNKKLFLTDFGVSVDYSGVDDRTKLPVYGSDDLTWPEAREYDIDTIMNAECENCFQLALLS